MNKAQQEVVDSNDNKILVLAGAGTGKTHCMLSRIKRLVDEGVPTSSILVLTFTNAAAYNMSSRFKKEDTSVFKKIPPEFKTFHAFCYSLIANDKEVREKLGYSKVPKIIVDSEYATLRKTVKMKYDIKLSDAKLNGEKTCLSRNEQFQYDLFQKCMKRELLQSNKITFDIICYDVCELFVAEHPVIQKYLDQYKYIFVDEFQDTDIKQWGFVKSFKNASIYLVGDSLQCQPAGTVITMSDMTYKNIEDIVPGDYVLSYNIRQAYYIRNLQKSGGVHRYTKKVTAISKHFATNIVRVTSETHSSRYTADHITYAKVHYDGNEESYVTYIMKHENGWWRVGSTRMFLKGGRDFGVRQRLRGEHGSYAWILGVYDTYDEAWLNEQIVSCKFGIPQTTWVVSNVKYTDDDLCRLYSELGDLTDNAKKCLEYYNRDIEYPMFTKVDRLKHFSKLHMFECHVCNLIPNVFDIVYPVDSGHSKLRNAYEVIRSISKEPDQYVYGLEVEDNHNYVGDGILTHNCLYGFRGADSSIIKSLSTNKDWTSFRLHENYRSTKQICDFANANSDYADDSYRVKIDSEKDGNEVHKIHMPYEYAKTMYDTILERCKVVEEGKTLAILCRTNSEVADIKELLEQNNIKCSSGSNDYSFLKKLLRVSTDDYDFLDFLASTLTNEQYAEYVRVKSLYDTFDIQKFLEIFQTKEMSEAIKLMNQLHMVIWNENYDYRLMYNNLLDVLKIPYMDSDLSDVETIDNLLEVVCCVLDTIQQPSNIYVGTIHSSKGLEYDEVHVVNVGGKSFKLSSEDNHNCYYVGITRAKTELYVYLVD